MRRHGRLAVAATNGPVSLVQLQLEGGEAMFARAKAPKSGQDCGNLQIQCGGRSRPNPKSSKRQFSLVLSHWWRQCSSCCVSIGTNLVWSCRQKVPSCATWTWLGLPCPSHASIRGPSGPLWAQLSPIITKACLGGLEVGGLSYVNLQQNRHFASMRQASKPS